MSSKVPKQKVKPSKATKLSQKLVVNVQAGEKSPVRADTPPLMSHHLRTRSGKIRAMTALEPSDKDYQEAGTDFQSFTKLHQLIYKTISEWAEQPNSRKNKFFQFWLTAWRDAITATSTYQVVKDKLHLKSIAGYKDHILQCPAITSAFDIWLNHSGTKIRYAIIAKEETETESLTVIAEDIRTERAEDDNVPTYADMMQEDSGNFVPSKLEIELQDTAFDAEAESQQEILHLKEDPKASMASSSSRNFSTKENIDDSALQSLLLDIEEETSPNGTTQHQNRFFHWMADRFNHRLGAIGNYLKDAQSSLDDKFSAITSRLQEVENMVVNLEKVLVITQEATMAKLHNTMHDMDIQVDKHLKTIGTQLNLVTTTISETCQFYESQIKSYCKQEEEDLKSTRAEAVSIVTQEAIDDHINPRFDDHLKAIDEATAEAIATITKEHKNAHHPVRTNNPPQQRNRWGQPQTLSNPTANTSGSMTQQRPPHQPNPYVVPCNHNDFIKKAQVRYTRKIFTFYNKLRNVGCQYGIYLHALDDIKYEASLCPPSYNGHIFTDIEYENMAATLYEKLVHTDVIPDQYNRFRNIIDRYVDSNDGFLVLYEMLEEEHPAMKQDPIQHPPTSSECQDDIQEYSARFTSYLVSERLNGRTY